ncbi:MAG: hypothetical protein JO033_21970 [Acidobacteriaceae bacterium]|nr:hypothetical protein [Acidobacteriaceae bacterium]
MKEFREEFAFPAAERGPVENWEFARLISAQVRSSGVGAAGWPVTASVATGSVLMA